MSITAFTLIVLAIYLVGLKLISIIAYKKSSTTTEDYFLSSREVGTFALIATMASSMFSSGTVIASPSEFYGDGTGYYWIFSFALCAVFMMPLVLKFWKLGKVKSFITPGDLLGDFYKSHKVKVLTGLIGLIALVPYAAAQMVAIGKTFETLSNGVISYEMGVTIISVSIGLYLYFGGSRAVIITDVVQGVTFASLLIVAGVLCVYWSDGWSNLVGTMLEKAPQNVQFKPSIGYYEHIPMCASFFLLPYIWQRMYMAKSVKTIAKNTMLLPIIFILLFSTTWVIGNSAFSILPEVLKDSDNVIGAIFNSKAPYFGAFILVAAFAAGMSTVDSQLLSAGSLFTKDIIPKRFIKNDYKVARIITMALMVGIFLWSLTLKSTSVLALIILGVSLTPILIPATYGAFFWKKASTEGAFWSMALGLGVFILHKWTSLLSFLDIGGSITWSFLTACSTYVVVSLLTNHKALDAKRKEYGSILYPQKTLSFKDIDLPKIEREEYLEEVSNR